MPSIANQDFKIYGLLKDYDRGSRSPLGIPGKFCGELYAAKMRAIGAKKIASFVDGFVFYGDGVDITRMSGVVGYFDFDELEYVFLYVPHHQDPAYYDALWAIQQAIFNYDGSIASSDMEFSAGGDDGDRLVDLGYTGASFVNEDGFYIKVTSKDGKLASLSIGEKADEAGIVVRLESLLPLVGELPLDTPEIW